MKEPCLLCGARDYEPWYRGRLLRCSGCELVRSPDDFTTERLAEIYNDSFFKGGDAYCDYLADRNDIERNFVARLNLATRLRSTPMSSIIEIGCAYGLFGNVIRERLGPEVRYVGFDVVEGPIQYGCAELGLDLRYGDYLDSTPNGPYSDAFLWDVIEHVRRPDLVLERLHRELQPRGRVYVTTGDLSAWVPRVQRHRWRLIHPSHIYYFTRATLERLLRRSGFSIVHLSYPWISRSVRQMLFSLFMLDAGASDWRRRLLESVPPRLFVKLNTFDIMYVVAERI